MVDAAHMAGLLCAELSAEAQNFERIFFAFQARLALVSSCSAAASAPLLARHLSHQCRAATSKRPRVRDCVCLQDSQFKGAQLPAYRLPPDFYMTSYRTSTAQATM